MKCPVCSCISSDKRDLCPKCGLDLRPHKQALGLPISHARVSTAELRRMYGMRKPAPAEVDQLKKTGDEHQDAKQPKRSWLRSLFKKEDVSEPTHTDTAPAAPAEAPAEIAPANEEPVVAESAAPEPSAPSSQEVIAHFAEQLLDAVDSTPEDNPHLEAVAKLEQIEVNEAAPVAELPMPSGAPHIAPEVVEFTDNDELLEQQLDAMLGDDTLEIEAVPTPRLDPRAEPSLDDEAVEFEIELDEAEGILSAAVGEAAAELQASAAEVEEVEQSPETTERQDAEDTVPAPGVHLVEEEEDLQALLDALEAPANDTNGEDTAWELPDDAPVAPPSEMPALSAEAESPEPVAEPQETASVSGDQVSEAVIAQEVEAELVPSAASSSAEEEDSPVDPLNRHMESPRTEQPATSTLTAHSTDEVLRNTREAEQLLTTIAQTAAGVVGSTHRPSGDNAADALERSDEQDRFSVGAEQSSESSDGDVIDDTDTEKDLATLLAALEDESESEIESPEEGSAAEEDVADDEDRGSLLQVMEFDEDDEMLERQLDALIGNVTLNIEPVKVAKKPAVERPAAEDEEVDILFDFSDIDEAASEPAAEQTAPRTDDAAPLSESRKQERRVEHAPTPLTDIPFFEGLVLDAADFSRQVAVLLAEAYGLDRPYTPRPQPLRNGALNEPPLAETVEEECDYEPPPSVTHDTGGSAMANGLDGTVSLPLPTVSPALWGAAWEEFDGLAEEEIEIAPHELWQEEPDEKFVMLFDLVRDEIEDPSAIRQFVSVVPTSERISIDNRELRTEFKRLEKRAIEEARREEETRHLKTGGLAPRAAAVMPQFATVALPIVPGALWRRIAAKLIDVGTMAALTLFVGVISFIPPETRVKLLSFQLLTLDDTLPIVCKLMGTAVILWIVLSGTLVAGWGKTIGKAALKLTVVNAAGYPIGLGQATLRAMSEITTMLTFGLGLLFGLAGKRRALHDMMAQTVVVQEPAK